MGVPGASGRMGYIEGTAPGVRGVLRLISRGGGGGE